MLPDKKDLELYIHIPFCVSKCKYCDFVSGPGTKEEIDRYTDALCKEILSVKGHYADRHITSIFFGGGTPSILPVEHFKKILDTIQESFGLVRQYGTIGPFSLDGKSGGKLGFYLKDAVRDLKNQIELTVECNPDTVDVKKFKEYKKLGVNRISFGLQSNMDADLKLLGRTYTTDDFTNAFFAARDAGMENINVDLIQAIPGQNTLEFMKSIYSLMMLGPDHISTYSLIVEEGTEFASRTVTDPDGQRYYLKEDGTRIPYPTEEVDRDIYRTASGFLNAAGIERYEISNFAKKDRQCRHNVGYWKRQSYLGFGVSAASMVDNVRWKNLSDRKRYTELCLSGPEGIRALREEEHKLSYKEQMSEFMFLGLRLSQGIAKEEFFEEFGVDFDHQYGEITRRFIDEGLLEVKEYEFYDPVKKTDYVKTRVFLTDQGIDVSNRVMAEYLVD